MGKPYVALLWHFHQPPYLEPNRPGGELAMPWVRLHAARDYYQMGRLVADWEGLRATFNFTPVLLAQLDAYVLEGRRDRLMELSFREPGKLRPAEADELISRAFDVSFEHVIKNHPRYFKLYRKYHRREAFSAAELTDAAALFNLAWTGEIFREGAVTLEGGAVVDLAPLHEKGGGYTRGDVEAIIAAQLEIMAAVVPLYRRLRDEGRVEISTTPYYHPILPLIHDSDLAAIDRPAATLPRRFAWPADAREQVARALRLYRDKFGAAPTGMWPAEGAVAEEVLPYFDEAGVAWIASDEGVLALSGERRYEPGRPELLSQPYRVGDGELAVFFRHRGLSDAIGFVYQHWPGEVSAAADFCERLGSFLSGARARSIHDALAGVILDGENAWGAYARQGVPFLRELYARLARGDVARAVTFGEYLTGAPQRDVAPHPPVTLDHLKPLACASWIDEAGSLPGNDLGTWVGEPDENRAWELLGEARDALEQSSAPAPAKAEAREYLLAAEASDWFWWYGDDQGGGADEEFDRLFRENVAAAYRALGVEPPAEIGEVVAPRRVIWRPDGQLSLRSGDLLVVEWPRAGGVYFGVNGWQRPTWRELAPATGVMPGPGEVFRAPLLRIGDDVRRVDFTFRAADGEWLGRDFFVLVA
jgi:alpha-amylase/alpha-mannosidase (GH57 family)